MEEKGGCATFEWAEEAATSGSAAGGCGAATRAGEPMSSSSSRLNENAATPRLGVDKTLEGVSKELEIGRATGAKTGAGSGGGAACSSAGF